MGIRGAGLVIKFGFTLFVAKFLAFEALGLYGLIFSAAILTRVIIGLSFSYTLSRKAVTQSLAQTCHEYKYYWFYTSLVYLSLIPIGIALGGVYGTLFIASFVILIAYTEHLANDMYVLLMNLSKPIIANIIHFIRSGGWMLVFMMAAYLVPDFRNIETVLSVWLVGNLLSLLLVIFVVKRWPWNKIPMNIPLRQWIKKEFVKSKTMYGTECLQTITTYINHFLITIFLGLELTGVYVYFMNLGSALINLMQTGIIQIYRPRMVVAFNAKKEFFEVYKKALLRTSVIAVSLGLIAGVCFYEITIILDKKAAIDSIYLLIPILFAFPLTIAAEINKLVFYSMHRDDIILKCIMLSFPFTLAMKCILVPTLQLWGVAITVVATGAAAMVLTFYYVKKLNIQQYSQVK